MNFITAKNCPLYMNLSQDDGAVNTGNHFFVATSVSLGVDSSLEANKVFGENRVSSDFSHNSPQVGKLSVDILPLIGPNSSANTANQMALITGVTGDFTNGARILWGNFDLRKCYLSSLNLKISPQEVISASADFDVYDLSRITGQSYTGANVSNLLTNNGSGAYLEGIHALAMGISGSGVSLPESRAEIDVSIRCNREPSYSLGSTEPSTVILTNVEKQVSIQGEGVGKICGFSGELAVLDLYFAPFSSFVEGGTGFNGVNSSLFSIKTRGRVSSQNLSAGENGLAGSVVIQENVF
jgi:hypothetical protein